MARLAKVVTAVVAAAFLALPATTGTFGIPMDEHPGLPGDVPELPDFGDIPDFG